VRPLAITAMAELGIDISRQESKTFDRYPGQPFDAVITVCDQANEACPVFRGAARRLHWRFPDPSKARGTEEEQLALLVEGPEDNGHMAECTGSGAGHGSRRAASRLYTPPRAADQPGCRRASIHRRRAERRGITTRGASWHWPRQGASCCAGRATQSSPRRCPVAQHLDPIVMAFLWGAPLSYRTATCREHRGPIG
jgi:hypothetical protein